ncbi:hypothetical protein ACTWPB_10020 [Nocardia sp. IBHARD005]|uniref:hypothetical protein n=1 Tax=Nocardia sp. IBHARD005 TaxID=3457765 RepID=UPI004058D5F9
MPTNPTAKGIAQSPDRRKRAGQRVPGEQQRPAATAETVADTNHAVQVGCWVRTKTGTRAHYVREIKPDGTYRTLCGKVRGVKDRVYELKAVVAIDDPIDMECQYCFGRCGKEGIRLLRS